MLPPSHQLLNGALRRSLSIASRGDGDGGAGSPSSDSATESDGTMDTWPTRDALTKKKFDREGENECGTELSVTRCISTSDKVTLGDIARGSVDVITERMNRLPYKYLEELKLQLRVILEGNGGARQREEFLTLQKHVQVRDDLSSEILFSAHQVQLVILVAIRTGIQAFLHPNISLSQSSLIDIFLYRRCRNIACQGQLPGYDCKCDVCVTKKGFCNICMCVICSKFDFDVNTCQWIGCDSCSHWTHTDCALRDGCINMDGPKAASIGGKAEMVFWCEACGKSCELLGWVKDVFLSCAPSWDREVLLRELSCVCRIFRASEDPEGRKLFWKCEDLIQKITSGFSEKTACKAILMFFQEPELEFSMASVKEEGGRLLVPQEACSRLAEVVREASKKMEMVAEQKMRLCKKARLAFEASDRELANKVREVEELEVKKQKEKQQINELDSVVRLKQAEANMFQLKADEARREAERIQRISLEKSGKSEDYSMSTYLKLRLDEAEAERQYMLSKLKL